MGFAPAALAALASSFQIAGLTVLVCTPVAVALAAWMARAPWRGKLVVDTLILLPMALPPAVVGLVLAGGLRAPGGPSDWLSMYTGWQPGLYPAGAMLAAVLMTLPLMVRVLRPAFEAGDAMLGPVARTLGASPWQTWWTVSLPMAWPAVLSAAALGLAAAWGETGATLVVATVLVPHPPGASTDTAPLALVAALRQADGGRVAWQLAWASLGVAVVAMLLSEWGRAHWRQRARQWARPAAGAAA